MGRVEKQLTVKPQGSGSQSIAYGRPEKGVRLTYVPGPTDGYLMALLAAPATAGPPQSGIIEAVGDGVTDLKVGDRVLAMVIWGGMAEKVSVQVSLCHRIPDDMRFEDAAAFVITSDTCQHALRDRARIEPGEMLLVLRASGGVGLAAVELGKALGARVIAAASTSEKLDVALRHGADDGVVYGQAALYAGAQKHFAKALKRVCGPLGANVILDPVEASYSEPALRSIAWKGRYLVIGLFDQSGDASVGASDAKSESNTEQ